MRTYRLQFSEDGTVLQRRISKLKASEAERALCLGFESPETLRELYSGVCALELRDQSKMPAEGSWDEIHIVLSKPEAIEDMSKNSKIFWVFQPNKFTSQAEWIQWLRTFEKKKLLDRVFVEFEPFISQKPHLYSIHEVSRFLHALKFHFPNWKVQRRPGVELWDSRIPDHFELEASADEPQAWNIQKKPPKLSVIIPAYNNKFFVYRVIEHLGRQTEGKDHFEVILVDDGSSDKTRDYFQAFGVPQGLQFRLIHWPRPQARHRGDTFFRAGLARNLGVRYARAENLAFLDSDILVPENFVETILLNLKEYDVLQFPRWHITQEKSRANNHYHQYSPKDLYIEECNYWEPFFNSSSWMSLPNFWKYTCTYALALKKKDFLQAGRFKRFYVSYGFEDTELGYHLSRLGKTFHLCSGTVLHLTSYSQSEYQMSQLRRAKLLKRTARQFFLSTLDLDNYHHFFSFMTGEYPFWARVKKGLYWKGKNTKLDERGPDAS